MGSKFELNWVLRLSEKQGLPSIEAIAMNAVFEFEKSDQRLYPIEMPIELVDQEWNVLAEVVIIELQISSSKTRGKFKVVNLPDSPKKSLYSRYPNFV